MINTVCVSIFKTLSESEVKAFGNYLAASYQKSGSIYKLYNYLKKNHPDLPEQKLTRKIVEKKLFKEKADPERTLFDATSKITTKLKNFITTQELEQHEVYQNFLYLEALKSRKLDELFFKKAESLQKKWDDDSIPGIEHLHNLYKLKVLIYSHPNFNVQKIKKESELKNIIDLLDQHYTISKMYYTLIYNINNKETITEKYSITKILKDLDDTTFSNKVKERLLHNFLAAYKSNNVKDFKCIKSTFFNIHHYFTQSEKHDLVDILKYFFYTKRREIKVTNELFEIVKFSLKESLLLEDGYLTSQSFINCIQFAQANNEIEWIAKFIQDYKDLLNEKDKIDCLIFGQIILNFSKNQFQEALEKLMLIKMREPFRVAEINCQKLQCLYELDYELAFSSTINAAKQYLSNHKQDFIELHLESFRNFILFVKEIYKSKSEITLYKKSTDALLELDSTIKLKKSVYNKRWLLIKIEELLRN